MNRTTPRLVCLSLLSALMGGCAGNSTSGRMPSAPKEPPAPPIARAVPLDHSLRTQARSILLAATHDSDPRVRANAIEALQETIGDDARFSILDGLNDPEPVVRFAACMAAGQLRIAEAHDRLLQLASDSNAHVQIGARFGLHRLGDTHLSHDFEKTSRHIDPAVRGDTALALGLLGEKSATKILRPMLDDDNPDVRLQAAEALWRLGDEEGLSPLVSGTVSGYADEQVQCILALAGPRDVRVAKHIYGRLQDNEWPEVGLAAARALGELGNYSGYTVAANAVRGRDPRLQSMGALALGSIGRADSQDLLAPLLKADQTPVRLAAATAILELKPATVADAR